jgi:hypothetical protein
MKYSELKSIVTEVVSELKLSQGYNRLPSKKKTAKPDFLDVDKDGDTEESMKKALKDKVKEYNSPEEEDDVITADPEIEEPQRKVKPRHPLMPPEESPEDAPKFKAKKEGKVSVNDIMSRYKSLKK